MPDREFTVVVEQDEDGILVGTVPDLPGCHTQARSLDELFERMKEAILLSLETAVDDEPPMRLVGVHRIAV
ncbi:MAG: type II toxin-antitoxin system HicB family antitoxin [Dehalococcoidia bacterium]|nr:type II toxin-antitoxin system HicB family antitoxin [Dehalococcoidia bacterium]